MTSRTPKRILAALLAMIAAASLAVQAQAVDNKKIAAAEAQAKKIESVLNRVQLKPVSTGNKSYDAQIASIVGEGTTYQRVKRGYTWLAKNMNYVDNAPQGSGNRYMQLAYGPLFAKKGSCKNYSAATYLMLRYIGLPEVRVVDGTIVNSNGSRQYHIWNTVTLEGVRYIVDAEVEGKLFNRKGGDYVRYDYFFANPATYTKNPSFFQQNVLDWSRDDTSIFMRFVSWIINLFS